MFEICRLRQALVKKEIEDLKRKNEFLEYKVEHLQDTIDMQSEYKDILIEYMLTLYVDKTIERLEEIREYVQKHGQEMPR